MPTDIVRARLVNSTMRYVFESATACGYSVGEAMRQAFEAAEWVKAVMRESGVK